MLDTFKNVFRIPDLRKKVLFTLLIIFIYRIGGHIPTPGINSGVLAEFWSQSRNNLFGLYDMFVGGAFGKATGLLKLESIDKAIDKRFPVKLASTNKGAVKMGYDMVEVKTL